MMALTSVIAAVLMKGQSEEFGVAVVVGVLLLGLVLGAINGSLVVVTRVPDIVVTLAMSFVWAGCALLVLQTPGGGSAAKWLKDLVIGSLGNEWIPKAAIVLIVVVARHLDPAPTVAARPVPVRHRQRPAGGVPERRAGRPDEDPRLRPDRPVLGARRDWPSPPAPGSGHPVPGPYTLLSVAAVVLGGVSLAGGRGGVFGPIVGVVILPLIRTDMTFLSIDPNLAVVAQGVILIGVVMVGSLVQMRTGATHEPAVTAGAAGAARG